MLARTLLLAPVALTLLLAGSALADVPPEPGYIEKCTVKNYAVDGHTCESCSAWHGERDACEKTLGNKGYSKQCQTRGASTWSEIWCKAGADKPPVKPVTKPVDKPDTPTESPADKPAEGKSAGDTPAKTAAKKSSCTGGDTPAGWIALSLFGLLAVRRRQSPLA